MELRLAVLVLATWEGLCRLLLRKAEALAVDYDLTCTVVGLMTLRHGSALDPQGIDLDKALRLVESGASLDGCPRSRIRRQPAVSPRVPRRPADRADAAQPLDGEPAINHVRTALEKGLHVVSANKGPLALPTVSCAIWPPLRAGLFCLRRR